MISVVSAAFFLIIKNKNRLAASPRLHCLQTAVPPPAPLLVIVRISHAAKTNRPGRRAHIPCPTAAGFGPTLKREPPPHPLAPRAVAFAWRAVFRQTRRARRRNRRLRAGRCGGYLFAGLSQAWFHFPPNGWICSILSEISRVFKRFRGAGPAARHGTQPRRNRASANVYSGFRRSLHLFRNPAARER